MYIVIFIIIILMWFVTVGLCVWNDEQRHKERKQHKNEIHIPMKHEIIRDEIVSIIKSFGYDPKCDDHDPTSFDIHFKVNNGYDGFPQRYKDAIRALSKGYLSCFEYETSGIQHVYMSKQLNGLEPDNNQYDSLMNQVYKILHKPTIYNTEMFVRDNHNFSRIVDFDDVTR